MLRTFVTLLLLTPFCAAQEMKELYHLAHDVTVSLKSPPDGMQQYAMPDFEVEVTTNDELNAHADLKTHTVYLSANLVRLFFRAPGELASVIAHEAGHLQDPDCKSRGAKLNYGGNLLQRYCEETADRIGMQYLMAAGYGPYDAAGALGRMLMSDPGQSSLFGIVVGRFMSDHPVTVDRIQQLAGEARAVCEERPEICK